MTWFGYFLIAYWALNALLYVAFIGRSMKYTAEMAAGMLVVYGLLILGVVTVGTGAP